MQSNFFSRLGRFCYVALLCAGLVVTVAGCGTSRLRVKAAGDLRCPEDQLVQRPVEGYVEKVTGCGRENVYGYDGSVKDWLSPLDRAPFDLSCPKDQLTTQHLGARNIGVSGCGKKAVYVYSDGSGWIMNSAESPAGAKQNADPASTN